jgi:putative ABC transport system permease protein
LLTGVPIQTALKGCVCKAMLAGMIPTINAMVATGLVALPGMMTGQILAGVEPVDAIKY